MFAHKRFRMPFNSKYLSSIGFLDFILEIDNQIADTERFMMLNDTRLAYLYTLIRRKKIWDAIQTWWIFLE